MTDIEGFLTIYGHSDNLLNNKLCYYVQAPSITQDNKKGAPKNQAETPPVN